MEIHKITVVGAGQMGNGITQILAQKGFKVNLYDNDQKAVARGLLAIDKSLNKLVAKDRLTEEQKKNIFNHIKPSIDLVNAKDSDLVIEAAPENMILKKTLFKALDQVCMPHTILATNTSSLSVTEIAAATKRAEQVIGMHFMNPVPVMPLVEVIRGVATSDDTFDCVMTLTKAIGKTAVEVRDFPGFVSNRVLMLMINEAIFTVYEGVASPESVDQVLKLGMNHPMGPLALADFIGLDTCLAIMETLQQGFSDSKYRPCPLLRNYVNAGWLGRKTGRGFFIYEAPG